MKVACKKKTQTLWVYKWSIIVHANQASVGGGFNVKKLSDKIGSSRPKFLERYKPACSNLHMYTLLIEHFRTSILISIPRPFWMLFGLIVSR